MAAAAEDGASSTQIDQAEDLAPAQEKSGLQNDGDEEREAKALLGWVQAVDSASEEGVLSRHVVAVDDLCDGVPFFDILGAVDHVYFRNPHSPDTKDNWVVKIGTLKRLYKLVLQYYTEVLEQSPRALLIPDLDALARDASCQELCKLGRLVIGIAVRSQRASEHIAAIQTLPIEDQQQLMFAIEQVMESLQGLQEDGAEEDKGLDESDPAAQTGDGDIKEEKRSEGEHRMEKLYLELLENHKSLQAFLDDTVTEKEEATKEMTRFKEEVERDRNTQADVLMRQEIERLKERLRKSEDNLAEAEMEVERLGGLVGEMTRKTDELQRKADEGAKLKDQMEEYKHASDRLLKTENVIEKYKKKLEEGADVRRQLKVVEAQYAELVDRNTAVEDEYKRVAAFKPLMDSYKGQIAQLENKSSTLQRDLNAARYEAEQVATKLRATEEARAKEKEEMDLYQERIQELELRGGISKRRNGAEGDLNGVEGLAANNEGGSEEDEEINENLEDALSGTTMTGLKIQVRKLARELRAAKANKADAGRLLVVENLLEDANKLKARYEKDYLREYQRSIVLEKQMEDILGAKSSLGDGPEANYALRLRLNETVDELDQARKELSRLKVEHDQTTRALNIARSDLTLVDKDKLEILEELRTSVAVEKAELERRLQQLGDDIDSKDEQLRMNISQINTLLMEKVDLQSDSIGQRDDALQREKDMGALRATLADSSLSEEAKQLVTDRENQVKALQEKLQKARAFIRQQDKMIKDANSKSTATPEEVLRESKQREQENMILRSEQRLVLSAWLEVNQRLSRELLINGTFRKNGSNRAQTKAAVALMGNKPRSWLQQQRNELSGGVPLARR